MIKKLLFSVFVLLPLVCFGKEYPQSSNVLTPSEKIYMLSKFWQEVNYNFAYFGENISRADWDKAYREYIGLVSESQDDCDFYILLRRFCRLLGDGHTCILKPDLKDGPENPDDVRMYMSSGNFFEEGSLWFYEIEGKVVVYKVDRELGKIIPLKSQVIKVNGIPIEQYLTENAWPGFTGGSHIDRFSAVDNLLTGKLGTKYDITIVKPDGKEATASLTLGVSDVENMEFDKLPYFDEYRGSMFDFDKTLNLTWPAKGIARLEINRLRDNAMLDRFKELLPELRTAKALIIDLRLNGGGSATNGTNILQYLTGDESLYVTHAKTRGHIANSKARGRYSTENENMTTDYKMWRDDFYMEASSGTIAVRPPIEERITVPTVILTGYFTAWSAEDFLVSADNQKHMIRIGQKTYGSTGIPLVIDLGHGFTGRICTTNDRFPDGRKFVGLGIEPHIEVEMTMKDYENTKDVTLLRALEYLKQELK